MHKSQGLLANLKAGSPFKPATAAVAEAPVYDLETDWNWPGVQRRGDLIAPDFKKTRGAVCEPQLVKKL